MCHKKTEMKIIKPLLIFLILLISCSDNKTTKEEPKHNIENDMIKSLNQNLNDNKVNISNQIEVDENKKLQFLFYSNGGLIGYYDDGTIVGCPRCDLMDENIKAMKSKKPHSRFKIIDDFLISEQGDTISIKSMKDNEWAIVNYTNNFNEERETYLNDNHKAIIKVALSFHKWYIRNTDGNHNSIPTDFEVKKGKNGYCIVDFEPYFNELRKLGTISDIFMDKEKKRSKLCTETISNMKWSEYIGVIPENCDDYDYWTQSQDFEDGNVGFKSIKKEKDNWKVLIYLFIDRNGKQNELQNAIATIKIENGKYMLTEIKWIEN